jgi:Kdo2-lipid IVA lauroyltransferase/acyltransferase
MRYWLEYLPVRLLAETLRRLPRRLARAVGRGIGMLVYRLHPRLRRVGMRNLALAFPEKSLEQRRRILKAVYRSLGQLLAEFSRFPDYTAENVEQIAIYDGKEHFEAARASGKGILFMTAHLGGWEIGSFIMAMHGDWLNIVARRFDNPLLERWVRSVRELHGNRMHDKDEYARGLLAAMKRHEIVAALMDTNMTPPQGVFVNYFGRPACTASGIARVAMRTGAVVLPAFTIWDERQRKYLLHFEPIVPTIRTGDEEADAVANTQSYTAVIEKMVRQYPDQWLWVHRRWKTRPSGEPSLY